MYIEIGKRLLNPVSGFADIAVDIGEIIHEDGSATIIHFRSMHGNFTIYEYNENWSDEENELFHGEYKVDGDTLTLQCSDGTEIVLSHAVDPLAKETEGS